jgi:hypothetical protein
MKQTPSAWNRLVDTARGAPDSRDVAPPYGFATRVAALAFADERPAGSVFARWSLRAMGVSCLLAVLAVAANYSSVQRLFDDSSPTAAAASAVPDDPMTALVDLATS